jgi:transposase
MKSRLRRVASRLEDAQRDRISTIVAAKRAGLSIRRIAESTGLSRSRVHQLLQEHSSDEGRSS